MKLAVVLFGLLCAVTAIPSTPVSVGKISSLSFTSFSHLFFAYQLRAVHKLVKLRPTLQDSQGL